MTKKQLKDIERANELLKKSFALFESATEGIKWDVIYGQTESAFFNLNGKLEGFVEYKKNNNA